MLEVNMQAKWQPRWFPIISLSGVRFIVCWIIMLAQWMLSQAAYQLQKPLHKLLYWQHPPLPESLILEGQDGHTLRLSPLNSVLLFEQFPAQN